MPTVAANGINLYYDERGSGPPLVCIMGITAPGAVWEAHADEWQRGFRCILPDNRGVGLSDKPAGPYTTEMMADDYAGLLDALGIARARVIGCSMGGTIAQQLALRHPEKVESMALMCSWARCDRYARSVFEHIKTIKARLTPAEFMNYIQLLIFAKPYWDAEGSYAALVEGRRLADEAPLVQPLHGLVAQAEACMTHNTLDALHRIACPTLVIGGADDVFTPRWMAEELAARIPHSELHLYPGAGHAFHWECIADFNPRIAKWFRNH